MDHQAALTLPLQTRSTLNLREHWGARHRRSQGQRKVVHQLWPWKGRAWKFPVQVQLTRIAPPRGRRMDDDNLAGALKAVRDQVAAELGVDDGDLVRVFFRPARQEKGEDYGVRVEVLELGEITPRPGALSVPGGGR